jgi:hypothetical protein
VIELTYTRAPAKLNSLLHGATRKNLMQFRAAHAEARRTGKIRSRNSHFVDKLNSPKGMCEFRGQTYAELSKCGDATRQNALSAGFVNWGRSSVENCDPKAAPASRDCRGDARRSRSDYDDLAVCNHETIPSIQSDAGEQEEDGVVALTLLWFDTLFTNPLRSSGLV